MIYEYLQMDLILGVPMTPGKWKRYIVKCKYPIVLRIIYHIANPCGLYSAFGNDIMF